MMTNLPSLTEMDKETRRRYARNISIEEIGLQGQERLCNSKVFILGCGALGSVVAAYLAGAGIGHITIADFDTIDISNLQRQIFYKTTQTGESKAQSLASHLRQLNPNINIQVIEKFIRPSDLEELLPGHDIMIDASDNPSTKYMTDNVSRRLEIPYILGGVLATRGQVMTWIPGTTPYSDFFPESDPEATPCSMAGVLGPAAGIIASIQAAEAIKFIAKSGKLLTNRLLLIDTLTLQFSEICTD